MEENKKPVFSFSHIGVNSGNTEEAREMASLLNSLFNLNANEGEASIFVEKEVEVIKSNGFGKCGHIAFYTEDIEEAVKYLEGKNVEFNMDSAKYCEDGTIKIVYFKKEINGFAIHLTCKK